MDRRRIIRHSTRLSQAHDEEPEDGITAEAAEIHLASDDYPEMGSILHDRPDPGQVIRVVGSRRTAGQKPWHVPFGADGAEHMYRGLSVRLPDEVHRIVHDEDRPEHVRALILARHFLANPHPNHPRGQGLGYSWTADPEWAKSMADQEGALPAGHTAVVLRAYRPGESDVLRDPGMLRQRAIDSGHHVMPSGHPIYEPDEDEYPLREGALVGFSGIAWHSSHPGDHGKWQEVHFPEALRTKASATYGRPDDVRDGEYNGGEADDTGMYWAEPGEQPWIEQHIGPQEEAPPPPWGDADFPPAMARLAQIEEARHFFGTPRQEMSRRATTINGTEVDNHGDAPEHGTLPRASEPNSYDTHSTEGDGDPKWNNPASDISKKDGNGATVGMYPEGMSAGGGPSLPVGAFTAIRMGADYGPMSVSGMQQHLMEAHNYTPGDVEWAMSDHDPDDHAGRREALYNSHLVHHAAEGFHRWEGHPHPRLVGGPASPRPSADEIDEANYRREAWEQHNPRDNGYLDDAVRQPRPVLPSDRVPPGSATYHAHEGPIDPVFGSRVPWTGHERSTLHSWDNVPTGTEGDFVPSPMFTVPPAGGTPVPEEERMHAEGAWESPIGYENNEPPRQREFGEPDWSTLSRGDRSDEMHEIQDYDDRKWTSEADPNDHRDHRRGRFDHTLSSRREAVSDSTWRMHLMRHHGLSDEQISHALAAGWTYPALNDHLNGLKREQEQRHEESVGNMFGADLGAQLRDAGQRRVNLARPEHGGYQAESDPATAIMSSEEGRPEYPDETRERNYGSWLRLMNSRHEAAASPEEEEAWRDHLMEHHGWNEGNVWRSIARGQRFSDMHDTLHQMGMANHVHSEPVSGREQSLNNMFGPDVRNSGRPRMPGSDLARPSNGGHSVPYPMIGLIRSREVPPPTHPDVYEQRDPARFRRMMSALDPPHEHDDDSNNLDAGPSEGDEGFPETHDDLDSSEDAPVPPQAWPLAGASITEGGPAYTQGREDGHGGRVFPPPPPMPVPGGGAPGEEGAPGGEGDDSGGDGKGKKIKIEIGAHLDAFTAAAGSPEFRFCFTAAWSDVVAKAKRIRSEGHVRITHASKGMVIGEVRGDHDTYESGIQRPPGRPQTIQHWACGCPWASFHQDKSLGTRYAGRPCSHVMALQFEAQAQGMFGREITTRERASWGKPDVTVKSWPPYEGDPHEGHWSEYWLAPSASLHQAAPECYYGHDGPCRPVTHGRTAESLYHERPAEFYSEIEPNPEHSPGDATSSYEAASHVLNGYLGPHLAGQIHFSRSDDGNAYEVRMMHTKEPAEGRGIASAMMDDLYDHVREHGRWLNHGERTGPGNYWWSGYAEPHPEVNTHHARPEEGWADYWSPHDVAPEMAANFANSHGEGVHTRLDWNYKNYPHDDRDEMWTHARGLQPPEQRATAALIAAGEDPGEVDALRMLADLSPSTRMIERHLETAHGASPTAIVSHNEGPGELERWHSVLHATGAAVRIPHDHDAGRGEPGPLRPVTAGDSILYRREERPGDVVENNVNEYLRRKREYRQEQLMSQRTGRGWETQLSPNDHFVSSPASAEGGVTHLMHGYMNGRLAGVVAAGASNNMAAWKVHNLHVLPEFRGSGTAEALMDSFYDHVKGLGGRWIDHGIKGGGEDHLWGNYTEPYPEMNIHNSHPGEGWHEYFDTARVHHDMLINSRNFPGTYAAPGWAPRELSRNVRNRWTRARGLNVDPHKGEWPDRPVNGFAEPISTGNAFPQRGFNPPLRGFGPGLRTTADQANAPWGSENVSHHPPVKPYGATEPPNKDQTPGSYGFLAAPDPDNWGSIQEDSPLQMPLTNTAAARPVPGDLHWPDMNGWDPVTHENQESSPYSDRSATGGPAASISPRDPNGIRMEESLSDPEMAAHLKDSHHQNPQWFSDIHGGHQLLHQDYDWPHGHEDSGDLSSGPDSWQAEAGHYEKHPGLIDPVFGSKGELHDEPEPALPSTTGDDDIEATAARMFYHGTNAADLEPGAIISPGLNDPSFNYDRPAKHAYITTSPGKARAYAEFRAGRMGGEAAVYHVEPIGPVRKDPEGVEHNYRAPQARVISRVSAADGTIGGGDAGSGEDSQAPADVAALGEFGAVRNHPQAYESVRDRFRRASGTPMGDLNRESFPQAQQPSVVTQEPGMGSMDEPLMPDDQSIQTIGTQQWSGGGAGSDEVAVEPGDSQGSIDSIVAQFQRSAAARQFSGGDSPGGGQGDGDIAAAARAFLSKTADVLPDKEAAELIAEGRGQRARNLGLLRLEGTHYEDEDEDLTRRGLSLDDFDDDVISV